MHLPSRLYHSDTYNVLASSIDVQIFPQNIFDSSPAFGKGDHIHANCSLSNSLCNSGSDRVAQEFSRLHFQNRIFQSLSSFH